MLWSWTAFIPCSLTFLHVNQTNSFSSLTTGGVPLVTIPGLSIAVLCWVPRRMTALYWPITLRRSSCSSGTSMSLWDSQKYLTDIEISLLSWCRQEILDSWMLLGDLFGFLHLITTGQLLVLVKFTCLCCCYDCCYSTVYQQPSVACLQSVTNISFRLVKFGKIQHTWPIFVSR